MSKNIKKDKILKKVMSEIDSGNVKMKPKSYFIFGAIAMIIGLTSMLIIGILFTSIIIFSLRLHGPMAQFKINTMIESFPWWALVLGILGTVVGIRLLKKYDFSYKKNFGAITGIIIFAILISSYLIDFWGIDNLWLKKGPLKGFYQDQIRKGCQINPNCKFNKRINHNEKYFYK